MFHEQAKEICPCLAKMYMTMFEVQEFKPTNISILTLSLDQFVYKRKPRKHHNNYNLHV